MNKLYNTKKYLKKLSSEQFKTLILIGLSECYTNYGYDYLSSISNLNDLFLNCPHSDEWDSIDFVYIQTYIGNQVIQNPKFIIDDFSMHIYNEYWEKDLSSVLHMYLANQFGEEYINYLYKKRIEDAFNETKFLTENYSNLSKNYEQIKILKKLKI